MSTTFGSFLAVVASSKEALLESYQQQRKVIGEMYELSEEDLRSVGGGSFDMVFNSE